MINRFNPAAGDVPVPEDPLEVELTLQSARVMWRAVPYFGLRYGERGARFGRSDVGWLVLLAGRPQAIQVEQLLWLAGLLAARGMPSWLLELQLRHLARSGRRLGWAGAEATARLADLLRDKRRAVVEERLFQAAGDAFAEAVGAPSSRLARGTGQLVASAHADVALGLCRSTDPLLAWLSDVDEGGALRRGIARVADVLRRTS